MSNEKECDRGKIIHESCWLLLKIDKRFFKDCKLKRILTRAPILKIADPNKYFVVCIDACKKGLGGVLS
jgi:hypothetical protein